MFLRYSSFEGISVSISTYKFVLVCIYRKDKVPFSIFESEFSDMLSELCTRNQAFIVCGDFNVHLNNYSNPLTANLLALTFEFNLIIREPCGPTHIDGNWLDFAMVSHDFPDVSSLVPDPLPVFSDHFPVEFAINFTSCERETVNPLPKRRFSSINFSEFNLDLADLLDYYTVCQYSDFHNLLTYLNSCLSHCLDKHAPLRVSKVSHTK